jgi:hypothetical protein
MLRFISLLLLILLAACSGIKPYHPENHREEGPPGGILTGPTGAFEIGVKGPLVK